MAPPPLIHFLSIKKVLFLYLLLSVLASLLLLSEESSSFQTQQTRRLLDLQNQEKPLKPKLTKNETNILKPNLSVKNQTKLLKSNLSTKNQTNKSNASMKNQTSIAGFELKKLNSTLKLKKLNSTTTSKLSNSTKSSSLLSKKSPDLTKISLPVNKTTKPKSKEESQSIQLQQKPEKNQQVKKASQVEQQKPKPKPKQKQPSWLDQEENDDLVAEFRDLPSRFQKTIFPDLEKISTTSKTYFTNANKEITKNFKPYVGNKYAPAIATIVSFTFLIVPLILVSLLVNRIKAYFSLQKLLIFIQVYLSIYFTILCLSSLVTGLEPLKFFYATSRYTYIWLQVLQSLAYIFYLLLLLMYLVLVFSTDCGLVSKMMGLGQIFVGFSVGLHYYVAVFHRVVLRQPPKTNWKIHGIYATCFLVICLLARADWRKKVYLVDDGEEGKKS